MLLVLVILAYAWPTEERSSVRRVVRDDSLARRVLWPVTGAERLPRSLEQLDQGRLPVEALAACQDDENALLARGKVERRYVTDDVTTVGQQEERLCLRLGREATHTSGDVQLEAPFQPDLFDPQIRSVRRGAATKGLDALGHKIGAVVWVHGFTRRRAARPR